ncbi:MAG: hypothetical protein MZV70_01135 [Desulfobacterales bacterium]|nr:hypothetical protein [Desulfobacterales bacterium]
MLPLAVVAVVGGLSAGGSPMDSTSLQTRQRVAGMEKTQLTFPAVGYGVITPLFIIASVVMQSPSSRTAHALT